MSKERELLQKALEIIESQRIQIDGLFCEPSVELDIEAEIKATLTAPAKERELLQQALEALDSVDEITAFGGEGEVVFCEVRCDIDKIIIAAKEIRDQLEALRNG